jgi:DNA helicase IV
MHNNKYVNAYCNNVKPVIGVDEATDYTIIDYYFISSFLHYEYSSLTLCGDIMQGLNAEGIKSWDELKKYLFPNMEIVELNRSYRQLPTLVDMSKRIYKDSQGLMPTYNTTFERQEIEPSPIYFISNDIEEKAKWISKRIIEVVNTYGDTVPSIGILVGDEVNIHELKEEIEEEDYLNGIDIVDCSDGRIPTNKNAVKIFRLTEVKGMEFQVAIFYDIDEALAGQPIDMMRRYLYVGISRASSHLAATFTKREGNEDIIKYFDSTKDNWKI